jgi:plasmid stabilization system protein ParE
MKIEFTHAALSDLQAIRDYTLATWGERQESIYLEALWSRFAVIAGSPDR